MDPEIVLLRAVGLLVGVPAFLLGVFWLLDRLESWVLKPDERAAEVQALLVQVDRADEVEEAVARLLAPFDTHRTEAGSRLGSRSARRKDTRASEAAADLQAPASPGSGQDLRRQEALADAQEALLEASTKKAAESSLEPADDVQDDPATAPPSSRSA